MRGAIAGIMYSKLKKLAITVLSAIITFIIIVVIAKYWFIKYKYTPMCIDLAKKINNWQIENPKINNKQDAINFVNKIIEIQIFPINPELNDQISEANKKINNTLDHIVSELERYSGKDYGHDYSKWYEWKQDIAEED